MNRDPGPGLCGMHDTGAVLTVTLRRDCRFSGIRLSDWQVTGRISEPTRLGIQPLRVQI